MLFQLLKTNKLVMNLVLKYFSGLMLLLSLSTMALASECYNNGTSPTFKILKKSDGIYYQFTQKDQNGFSYVKQQNVLLKGIDALTYKATGEDEQTLMFGDKNGFYILPKREQYDKNTSVYFKILGANPNQKHINGRLFLLNGKWTYLDAWEKSITKIVLNELPQNITNIKSYAYGFYVKSDKNVFVVSVDQASSPKYKVAIVPDLNPAATVSYAFNPFNNEDFLADASHLYSIRREGSADNLTPQMLALGLKTDMNKLTIIDTNLPSWYLNGQLLKKREGISTTGRNPISGEEIDIDYSFSSGKILQPLYGNSNYTLFRGKMYPIWDNHYSQPYDVKTNAKSLKLIEGKLFRGDDFYYIEGDDDFKIINTHISADAKFFPSIGSYLNYLPKALVDDKYIYFIGDRFNIHLENKKALTSKMVKQLGMFYLFNHSLYDGEKLYPITADEETLSYLGSFVEVINECADSMPNSPSVTVNYHNFFKDANHVYYFDNEKHHLQIIHTADVENTKLDDYETLQSLYKIKDVKGSIKKKVSEPLNYYLIATCVMLVLGIGVYIFKRRDTH